MTGLPSLNVLFSQLILCKSIIVFILSLEVIFMIVFSFYFISSELEMCQASCDTDSETFANILHNATKRT